ncbi:DUF4362 domain-containing protein [Paenibacillus eucommiae]|uniref:DUF4362 domain-containing protein n=1 Tax=Paenibacillus eucommiae TaxID=1355755 RepID=A0ABS4IP56_9BACL|nr:DUF4362 domain-containing protein [Paenibacillus eucommiae]MBP1989348.1 hypothetical protein [Paenibacillus eucommiae]
MHVRFVFLILLCSALLTSCNSVYDYETAIKNGDIVDLHGNMNNMERLDTFKTNMNLQKKDKVRITRFTIEGDPIFYNLAYNGTDIKLTYDNSKDKHGKKRIRSTNCKSLFIGKSDAGEAYKLEGCYGDHKDLGESFELPIGIIKGLN